MSDAPDDVVTVTVEGVTVEKTFEPDRFPAPAFRLDLVSDREDPVAVRVVDDVPAAFDPEDVGFRHEDDDLAWTGYTDEGVELERTLEPFEHVTVVYGLRTDDVEAARAALAEPTVEVDEGA
jgi:hypothetical protein